MTLRSAVAARFRLGTLSARLEERGGAEHQGDEQREGEKSDKARFGRVGIARHEPHERGVGPANERARRKVEQHELQEHAPLDSCSLESRGGDAAVDAQRRREHERGAGQSGPMFAEVTAVEQEAQADSEPREDEPKHDQRQRNSRQIEVFRARGR